jgi:hypothetical protein
MLKKKLDDSYYQSLHKKIEKFNYTIMSIVSSEAESPEHSAFCYTIGLSNYGHPEIMFVDCYYDDVVSACDSVLENISNGEILSSGRTVSVGGREIKAIELIPGVKEELTEQAKNYFELFRAERKNYDLIFVSFADEFGLYPDEKIFSESKHVKKLFFKQSFTNNFGMNNNLAMPQVLTVQ